MDWKDIDGWFEEDDFGEVYREAVARAPADRQSTFVEVGCWLGRSTAFLAAEIQKSGKPIRLYATDTWAGTHGDHAHLGVVRSSGGTVAHRFVENMIACGVMEIITVRCCPSLIAVQEHQFESVDFCWIDADHSASAVGLDLAAWWRRIRRGGYLGGHDYDNPVWPGVKQAVDRFFARSPEPMAVRGTSFLVMKGDGVTPKEIADGSYLGGAREAVRVGWGPPDPIKRQFVLDDKTDKVSEAIKPKLTEGDK